MIIGKRVLVLGIIMLFIGLGITPGVSNISASDVFNIKENFAKLATCINL